LLSIAHDHDSQTSELHDVVANLSIASLVGIVVAVAMLLLLLWSSSVELHFPLLLQKVSTDSTLQEEWKTRLLLGYGLSPVFGDGGISACDFHSCKA
jgi:hypothetical protein